MTQDVHSTIILFTPILAQSVTHILFSSVPVNHVLEQTCFTDISSYHKQGMSIKATQVPSSISKQLSAKR